MLVGKERREGETGTRETRNHPSLSLVQMYFSMCLFHSNKEPSNKELKLRLVLQFSILRLCVVFFLCIS